MNVEKIVEIEDGFDNPNHYKIQLSKKFNAPEETILSDVIEMLQNLSDKGFIEEN